MLRRAATAAAILCALGACHQESDAIKPPAQSPAPSTTQAEAETTSPGFLDCDELVLAMEAVGLDAISCDGPHTEWPRLLALAERVKWTSHQVAEAALEKYPTRGALEEEWHRWWFEVVLLRVVFELPQEWPLDQHMRYNTFLPSRFGGWKAVLEDRARRPPSWPVEILNGCPALICDESFVFYTGPKYNGLAEYRYFRSKYPFREPPSSSAAMR